MAACTSLDAGLSARPATEADIPHLLEIGARFHALSDEPGAFCPETFANSCRMFMEKGCLFVSGSGMIGGFAWPSLWSRDHTVTMESFWWAENGEGDALLDAFEAWARDRGAGDTRMGYLHALRPEAVERKLRARGYEPLETVMVKRW